MSATTLTVHCPDEAATERLGEALASVLAVGDLVALSGDLGAGKSVLARSVLRWLAADPEFEAASPTYNLVHVYDALPLRIAHADFYRLETPDDALELGLDEARDAGAVLVEWPERGLGVLPPADLVINIEADGLGRRLQLRANSAGGVAVTARLREQP